MTSPASDARRERVLTAAIAVAERVGWPNLTRDLVATEAGVAAGTVNNAMGVGGTMRDLSDAVMAEAVERGVLAIVAQGIAAGHPVARAAPAGMRADAVALLVG